MMPAELNKIKPSHKMEPLVLSAAVWEAQVLTTLDIPFVYIFFHCSCCSFLNYSSWIPDESACVTIVGWHAKMLLSRRTAGRSIV